MIQVDGIFVQQGGGGGMPLFSYTGNVIYVGEGSNNWRVYFTTSGILVSPENMQVDLCLIGGGQAGGSGTTYPSGGTGGPHGAPGEMTTIKSVVLQKNVEYEITIGAGGPTNLAIGGNTTFASYEANGGSSANLAQTSIPEFGDSNVYQAGIGGNGGNMGGAGADGESCGNELYPEPGGSGGNPGSNGGSGSRGSGGGFAPSGGSRLGGGGGGGGGYGASGGGGGGTNSNHNSNVGSGGAGAPGVVIMRNTRLAA